jgi:hypothetical protein
MIKNFDHSLTPENVLDRWLTLFFVLL